MGGSEDNSGLGIDCGVVIIYGRLIVVHDNF
jgi:hypothetical protein